MLRYWLALGLLIFVSASWAVPVELAGTAPVLVYAHPQAGEAAIGELSADAKVDVIATDMSKGYLLINYQKQQAWIQASSVVNTSNASKADDSVQQVLDRALLTAGDKVGTAVNSAQSALTSRVNAMSVGAQVQAMVDKQARRWFLTGALVLLLGLVLGLLLGKVLWRPRRSFLR